MLVIYAALCALSAGMWDRDAPRGGARRRVAHGGRAAGAEAGADEHTARRAVVPMDDGTGAPGLCGKGGGGGGGGRTRARWAEERGRPAPTTRGGLQAGSTGPARPRRPIRRQRGSNSKPAKVPAGQLRKWRPTLGHEHFYVPATGIRTRQGGSVLPGVNSPGRGELLRRGGDGGGARRGGAHGGGAERGRERMFVYLETGGAAQGWASSGWGREERPRKSMYGDLCGGRASARRRSDAEARRWRVARRARTMVMSTRRGERRECQTGRRWRESRVRASDNIKCH